MNQSFATQYSAGRNPIGLHVARDETYDPAHAYEIVGVVKEAHYFGLREATEPMIYVPIWREAGGGNVLAIRTAGPTAGLVDAVRRQVTATDPAVPMLTARTIEQQIGNNILEDRLLMTLTGFFGSLALLLAAVGLYGVISFAVTRPQDARTMVSGSLALVLVAALASLVPTLRATRVDPMVALRHD